MLWQSKVSLGRTPFICQLCSLGNVLEMFLEKLDTNLTETLAINGIESPTSLQTAGMAKIIAGGDVVFIGPKGSGKTTLLAITLIHKLKEAFEDAPRAVVFVPNKDAALAFQEQCKLLAKHTDLRFLCAFEGKPWQDQLDAIYIGADVVIGTVSRLQEIYFKNGLNLNKVKVFAIDNGEIITHISQVRYERMFMSAPKKCQHLLFTTQFTDRLDKMTEVYMPHAHMLEIKEEKID